MEKRYLTVKELSTYLGFSVSTLYQWVSQRKLRPIKIGKGRIRFDKKDVDEFMQNQKENT